MVMFNKVPVMGQRQETSISDADVEGMRGPWGGARGLGICRLEGVGGAVTEVEVSQGRESNEKIDIDMF